MDENVNEVAQTNQYSNRSNFSEAAAVFNCARKWFFWLILLSLLTTQTLFWLGFAGKISAEKCDKCKQCDIAVPVSVNDNVSWFDQTQPPIPPALEPKDVQSADTEPVKPAVDKVEELASPTKEAVEETAKTIEQTVQEVQKTVEGGISELAETKADDVKVDNEVKADKETEAKKPGFMSKIFPISCCCAAWTIKICNFVLIFSSVLYCLMILMTLKLALLGRMSNLKALSEAFIASLILVVLIMPWQSLLPGFVTSVIYTPAELLSGMWAKCDGSIVYKSLYFLRFAGMWFVGFCFLICSQLGAGRWAKAKMPK